MAVEPKTCHVYSGRLVPLRNGRSHKLIIYWWLNHLIIFVVILEFQLFFRYSYYYYKGLSRRYIYLKQQSSLVLRDSCLHPPPDEWWIHLKDSTLTDIYILYTYPYSIYIIDYRSKKKGNAVIAYFTDNKINKSKK